MTKSDLFPGFESQFIEIPSGKFFARTGGKASSPAIVLLHGFPETHASWHKIAPALTDTHRVICIDLKGYGQSDAPHGNSEHTSYSKRVMGQEVIQVMKKLGHETFSVAGHDRGALVAYRIALDHPEVVEKLVILDNLPTSVIWDMMALDPNFVTHWRSMAAPAPGPENAMDREYMENMLRVHTADGTLDCFDPQVLENFRDNWSQPARVHAFCEDYRAGAGADPDADRVDLAAGKILSCPTLILWGEVFLGKAEESPLMTWQRTFAPNAIGVELPGGHFNAEESPIETLSALQAFLA